MPTPTDMTDLTDSQKFIILSIGLNNVQNKVEAHDRLLVAGEGSALPVMERLRNVEAFIASQRYWAKFLLGAILIQTVTFVSAAIVYFIKLYPILARLASTP
jgi:hypothetical protein